MNKEKFTSISLHQEMQRSYLEYAMSVIVGRALPDAKDGLKPVQRRILFAMHELGLTPDRPFRKCARVVGDVLGKYHPHGDQAVYDALVRLVQDFSTKHPALDGHGNFGSIDDDPPAAMRYTETKLAPIAHEALLKEIGSDTVSYSENFDGSQKEPDVLPAQLPFLLLNGSAGIAVGMATNIPPHNIGEVIEALVAFVKNNDLSDEKLNKIILGPDFPTGGEIIEGEGIRDLYEKGKGSITIRGIIKLEELNLGKGKHKKNALIITELPYQISKSGWIEKLADLVNHNKISGISDIRDESDRDGMRIIIELKRDYNQDILISELYKKTTLQTNFGAIFLALINGKPVQLSLRQYLKHFLEFREKTIIKRTKYFLNLATEKLEVLEGFAKAIKNIKIIIEIVQNSENSAEAKNKIIEKINLSDKQSDAVLGMPIKKLTTLERNQIDEEITELKKKKISLNKIIKDRNVLLETLIKELYLLKEKYNVKRKTKIIRNINQEEEIETINKQILEEHINKKTKISIDNKYYLKKIVINNYKKIIESDNKFISNKSSFKFICEITKNFKIIAITEHGKFIQINWEKSIKQDCKLDNKFLNNINPKEIINFHKINNNNDFLCLINNEGRFKKIIIDEEIYNSNRISTIAKTKQDNKIIDSFIATENDFLIILTSIGRIFKFSLSNKYITPTSKQAQGTIFSKLLPSETIICTCKCEQKQSLVLATKRGVFMRMNAWEIYDAHESKLGYLDERLKIKNDSLIKIFPQNNYCEIETNRERSARINFEKLSVASKRDIFDTQFFNLEKDEYINNISYSENFLN
tara:strand:- start:6244 stop:8682 length:2439 start_codon:yes stop_codon:yes gene_type:complete